LIRGDFREERCELLRQAIDGFAVVEIGVE